ncbi:hypothetical protein PV735_11195 [Streptomyces turgidiscabies]|uniref:Uncharacterized protein n=1 Tax=Streptomyces turgidiscabies (strain Car8) TaxID=698760 RepID=L7EWR1_STRT8|nr:hypothetical protein [Streptomyces turgidiscabies]ELP62830.1 hypothetical protein STRTUCAR8_06418 [Streptomyces turgidiscabies Car8]MDX3493249.1 hypothetical protein [Streptomyces turgidiscabies]GAQ70549.1 hypothetical protein T45_02285 [Streptomyces turgidiscabies]
MSAGRSRGSDRLATASRETTPAERAAAARLVLKRGTSRDDLRDLLDMLGLDRAAETGGA